MQVEAIYDKGKLEFLSPVRFARDRFSVLVELPDDEIIPEERPKQAEDSAVLPDLAGYKLLAKIRETLGPLHRVRPLAGVEEDKAAYVEALAEKYGR